MSLGKQPQLPQFIAIFFSMTIKFAVSFLGTRERMFIKFPSLFTLTKFEQVDQPVKDGGDFE